MLRRREAIEALAAWVLDAGLLWLEAPYARSPTAWSQDLGLRMHDFHETTVELRWDDPDAWKKALLRAKALRPDLSGIPSSSESMSR